MYNLLLFFFFKQKTAYEMSISDWISDVCSSDLHRAHATRDDSASLQPLVCIIGTQAQPIFGAAGEHAIGLGDPAGHEIVDQHSDVGLGAVDHESGGLPLAAWSTGSQGRVDQIGRAHV